jgi:ParB family transcriptional regulator, chromosome partitioning protein
MASKKTGLGRGLDSLIPKDFDNSLLTDLNERIQNLKLGDIVANPKQPRRHFDETSLKELAESIKRHGILQPLVVTPQKDGKYTIIAGERRWRAAKIAGLKSLSAIIRSAKELEQLEIALVENVQRVDLSPLEQAVSIQRLRDQFSLGYEAIGHRLGKATTTITNIVRLLSLPQNAQEALIDQKISEGHARAVLALKDPKKQQELLDLIIKKYWTVRQAENFVTASKQGVTSSEKAQEKVQSTSPETKALSKKLSTKVTIRRTAKGGKVEIAFKSDDDLWRITNKILGS